ncbi:hypothetical protein ES708_19820 [subsurface metagenome]
MKDLESLRIIDRFFKEVKLKAKKDKWSQLKRQQRKLKKKKTKKRR